MKVTEIEVHQIHLEFVDFLAYQFNHVFVWPLRTILVARTDTGLVGLGESSHPVPEETVDQYIGTNPFDWLGDDTCLNLGTAMYDLMGQAAGVPVYQLFGQKHRSWVPMASWTVSTHPHLMAATVEEFAARGFTWLKYHLDWTQNVLDQTEAMQAVAPPGFRIHYDLTGGGSDDHIPDLLEKLTQYPIAGCFEDPLDDGDIQGAKELRQRIKLPILRHRAPMENTYEVLMGAVDGCIEGHRKIADAIRLAGLCAAGNIPCSIQHTGGTITQAMDLHMHAAFPTATLHCNSDAEFLKSDVVKERFEPINGFVRVPESPGLGVTLDREELERLENLPPPDWKKWILVIRFKNGSTLYFPADPEVRHYPMGKPSRRHQIPLSYAAPIETEYWDDDGTPEFREMLARLECEGMVLEGQREHQ